jgi:peptidyl-prolyl cis-trans isomerase SurA
MLRAVRSAFAVLVLGAGLVALPTGPGRAQDTLRAAIVVNDAVISELELVMRMRLTMISAGLRENEETRLRIQPQVIRALVDEMIQSQEAERLGIVVDEAQVDETFARIAGNNNLQPEQLAQALVQSGILPDYLKDQIRAQLLWQQVVARRLRPQVQIAPEEIDEAVARLEATRNQPQRLLAEIFLGIDNVTEEGPIREQANQIYEDLQKGANFPALARQFSQSASAANGGDLGWVEPGQLPTELETAIAGLRPGQLSQPIETVNGIYLILVREQRTAPENEVTVMLKQVFFPVRERTRDALERAAGKAVEAAAAITTCADVAGVAERMQSPGTVDLGTLNLADLPANLRQMVTTLPINQASPPIEVPGGVSTVVVCDRQDGGINRAKVEERLVRDKLEVLARRLMRDLRRAANVEIRI